MSEKLNLLEEAGIKREEIESFVKYMKCVIMKNSKKGRTWANPSKMTKDFLVNKLTEEFQEYLTSYDPMELIDIANICLMLFLRADQGIDSIDPKIKNHPKGATGK